MFATAIITWSKAPGGFVGTWLTVYSYLVWREDPDKVHPAGTLPAGEG